MMCVLLTAISITLLRGGNWIGVSATADSYDFRSYNTDLTKIKQQLELQQKEIEFYYNQLLQFFFWLLKHNKI